MAVLGARNKSQRYSAYCRDHLKEFTQRRLRHQPTPFTAELNHLIAQCVGRQSAAPAVYVMDLGFSQGEGTVVFVDPQEGDVTRTPSRNSRCKYVMEVKLKMQRR